HALRAQALDFGGELRHAARAEHHAHRHGNIGELVHGRRSIIVQSRNELAVIVGAGSGLSASLARKCAAAQMSVALAARNIGKLQPLAQETGASVHACDAADAAQVDALFGALDAPDLVIYNPSYRIRGPFHGLDREEVRKTLMVTAYGGFLVAQAALKRMLERGRGARFFTGASASVMGYEGSSLLSYGT